MGGFRREDAPLDGTQGMLEAFRLRARRARDRAHDHVRSEEVLLLQVVQRIVRGVLVVHRPDEGQAGRRGAPRGRVDVRQERLPLLRGRADGHEEVVGDVPGHDAGADAGRGATAGASALVVQAEDGAPGGRLDPPDAELVVRGEVAVAADGVVAPVVEGDVGRRARKVRQVGKTLPSVVLVAREADGVTVASVASPARHDQRTSVVAMLRKAVGAELVKHNRRVDVRDGGLLERVRLSLLVVDPPEVNALLTVLRRYGANGNIFLSGRVGLVVEVERDVLAWGATQGGAHLLVGVLGVADAVVLVHVGANGEALGLHPVEHLLQPREAVLVPREGAPGPVEVPIHVEDPGVQRHAPALEVLHHGPHGLTVEVEPPSEHGAQRVPWGQRRGAGGDEVVLQGSGIVQPVHEDGDVGGVPGGMEPALPLQRRTCIVDDRPAGARRKAPHTVLLRVVHGWRYLVVAVEVQGLCSTVQGAGSAAQIAHLWIVAIRPAVRAVIAARHHDRPSRRSHRFVANRRTAGVRHLPSMACIAARHPVAQRPGAQEGEGGLIDEPQFQVELDSDEPVGHGREAQRPIKKRR
mmetsp:Transcript_27556/g.91466  ORF Transcript_27556/g.91466 Transcript_27556/m.91466 type:complete len:580 (-) Transcript_27556:99-1838(-)